MLVQQLSSRIHLSKPLVFHHDWDMDACGSSLESFEDSGAHLSRLAAALLTKILGTGKICSPAIACILFKLDLLVTERLHDCRKYISGQIAEFYATPPSAPSIFIASF